MFPSISSIQTHYYDQQANEYVNRFQECESIFVDGDIKLLQTHGDCPKGEIFCSIVGACGKEEACPQKCDRTCTVV